MLKPFQILWELIEFALQALFIYVLALIIIVGLLFYVIADNREKVVIKHVKVKENPYIYKKVIEEKKEQECKRPAGCRVLKDGTVEY